MLNPNQGYKKFVMKLKQRYTVSQKSSYQASAMPKIERGKGKEAFFRRALDIRDLVNDLS